MNEVVSNPFGSNSVVKAQSAGISQMEQREMAEVQAAVIMAKRYPRDQVAAVDRIINSFSRPGLAEVSQYQYNKGGADVSGPSIRSAEAMAQQWGNIDFGFREVSRGIGQDGVGFSDVIAYAWDLESLSRKPLQFIVRHWRDTKRGGYALKDEREIYELVANMAQRRVRACLLSIIPGDVTEVAMNQADLTMKAQADTSPEAMQKMVAAFGAFEVTKDQIEARIQRRIDAIQPAQVVSLKKIYVSLRDGMSAAADWFEVGEPKKAPTGASGLKDVVTPKNNSTTSPKDGGVDKSTGEIIDPDDQALREVEQMKPAGSFQPSAEEIAAIHAREMAEAGQGEQQTQTRGRRERGSMNVE